MVQRQGHEARTMKEKALLDDVAALKKVDRSGMALMIGGLPDVMASLSSRPDPKVAFDGQVTGLIFSGMGGSAIGGDVIRSWLGPITKLPIYVNRGYGIPAFADGSTVFIAVSFSGNTEETLSAFDEALKRGCKVVALSSGGRLKDRADEAGVPFLKIEAPAGTVPRAALGHMLVPMAKLMAALGLADVKDELGETVSVLKRLSGQLGPKVEWEANESKGIATKVHGTIPVIHGHGILEVAALRWKTQLNENSKVLAWADMLPEMDHNSIVGWSGDPTVQNHSSIILRDRISEDQEPRMRKRIEATRMVGWAKAGRVIDVSSEGEGVLARIMSTIYKGDFASLYLAILRRVDPTPVDVIEGLKERLRDK
jgi:glucose/mannose-6-phosphate isomerase